MNSNNLEEKCVWSNGGKISYFLDRPFLDKPTVVFLHGLSSNHTTWLNIISAVHEIGYNSLTLDLRGHGLSDKTKKRDLYSFSVFSDDLNKILKQEDIADIILVGYSFGGEIAIDYSINYPEFVKKLVLISANFTSPLDYRGLSILNPVFSGVLNALGGLLLWQGNGKYMYYQHKDSVGYWDSVLDGFRTMPISINFWMLSLMFGIDFRRQIQKLDISTIIIRGSGDLFISQKEVEDASKNIKKSKVIVSKHPSHFVASDSQDEIKEVIINFLR
jgi:pimeloyl-ACP methyl ester carboxylesterase